MINVIKQTVAGVEHHRVCEILPENIWRKLLLVMISEEKDVGDHQADDDQRLQGDQSSQIIHLNGIIAWLGSSV